MTMTRKELRRQMMRTLTPLEKAVIKQMEGNIQILAQPLAEALSDSKGQSMLLRFADQDGWWDDENEESEKNKTWAVAEALCWEMRETVLKNPMREFLYDVITSVAVAVAKEKMS